MKRKFIIPAVIIQLILCLIVLSQNRGVVTQPVSKLPSKEKRFALIIGVSQYEDANITSLPGANNDARALRDALRDYAGFEENRMILLTTDQSRDRQPTKNNILRYLGNLSGTVPKDGLLLVAFSGHGIERQNQAFLMASDTPYNENVRVLERTALNVQNDLKELIRDTGVGQVVVLLDACRNDPSSGRSGSDNPLTEAYKNGFSFDIRNKEIEAFATIYATSIGERAYENTHEGKGYFTWAFIEGLKGGAANQKDEVTLGELIRYVERHVPQQVKIDLGGGKSQRPFSIVEGYKADELVLGIVKKPAPVSGASANAAALRRRWDEMLKDSNSWAKIIAEAGAEIKRDPASVSAFSVRSYAYFIKNDMERGRADAETVLRLLTNPQTAEDYTSRCHSYRRLEQYDKAVADCTRAIELDPWSLWAYHNRGTVYLNSKNYDFAIPDFNQAIEIDSTFGFAYSNRGGAYDGKKQFDSALADYSKAIQINPKDEWNYFNRGVLYNEQKRDHDKALADFSKIIQINPQSTLGYSNRGFTYEQKEEYDSALDDYARAIAIEPKSAWILFRRGYIFAQKNNCAKAIEDFNKVVEIDPKNYPNAYFWIGDCRHSLGEYDLAIAAFNKAVEMEPQTVPSYGGRGSSYQMKNDFDRALADFDKAILLDPGYAWAYRLRGAFYNDVRKDYDKALADFDKAVELDPKNADYVSCRGLAYKNKNENYRAIADLSKAIDLAPTFAWAYQVRAEVYEKIGRNDLAKLDRDKMAELEKKK